MKLKQQDNQLWKVILVMLLVLTGIYLGLYHNFIFGDQLYTYEDVGKDTSEQCLPSMVFAANKVKEGFGTGYHLDFGFGKYCENMNSKMLRLENIPYLVFGEHQLHIAVMVSLYLKYAAICLVAFFFFRRLFHNEWTSAVSALIWTFCGYLILWGQNYPFLAAMLAFTVAMYGFQLYLEGNKWQILVVPAVALLALTNYYHLYIVTFYFLIYGVLYLSFTGKKPIEILKKAGIFALAMMVSVAMAGTYILPAIANFFDSTRIGQVKASMDSMGLFYEFYIIAAFVARFFSTNLIGIGNEFVGPTNYYECAILSVSILFVFALLYGMQTKYWKRYLTITLASVILLCMPKVSQMLNFAFNAQRWAFLLSFSQVIAIGFAMTHVWNHWKQLGTGKKIVISFIAGDLIIAAVMIFGEFYNRRIGGWFIHHSAMYIVFIVVAVYNLCALVMWFVKHPVVPLLIAVAFEMILGNYMTVNIRDTVSVAEWYQDNFYDGTAELVNALKQEDDHVYRISKTYKSVGNMDPLMQGYNGTSVYFSTNPASLVNLAKVYGYGDVGNWISFDGNDLLSNTMLGVQYVITERETPMNPRFYELIFEDDTHAVYENIYYLGMGYLYDNSMDEKLLAGTTLEKLMQLSTGYYVKDQITDDSIKVSEHTVSVMESASIASDGEYKVYRVQIPELEDKWLVSGVNVTLKSDDGGTAYLYGAASEGEMWRLDQKDITDSQKQLIMNIRDSAALTDLELDVPETCQIEDIELILVDGDKLSCNLMNLQQGAMTNMAQTGNTFTGTVENHSDKTMQLCVPLIYEPYWRATVDGQQVEVQNVNGGLTGLKVAPGAHEISITYHNPYVVAGNILTAVSIVGYGVFVWLYFKKKNSN